MIKQYGIQFVNFTSLDAILSFSNEMSVMRYSGQSIHSTFSQIFVIFVYLAPLYGGFLYAQVRNKKLKKYCLMTILLSFLSLVLSNAKLGLIYGAISWCASYFVCCVFLQKPVFGEINIKTILKLTVIIIVFNGILFTSMVLRTGKADGYTIDNTKVKFELYLFGGLAAADIWFNNYLEKDNHDYYYGAKTFGGISNFLGVLERKQGVFTNETIYGKNNGQQLSTNIYTIVRCVIEDYGLIGSVLFFLMTGLLASHSYYRVKIKRNIYINVTIFMLCLTTYLVMWLQSVTVMYTSTLMAFILLYFVLKCSYSRIQII
jgi:oligosaccharide repeat unit polymerase